MKETPTTPARGSAVFLDDGTRASLPGRAERMKTTKPRPAKASIRAQAPGTGHSGDETVSSRRTVALDSVLTKDEFFKLMQAAESGHDRIILSLGVLGLRASEIGACRREWVDLSQQTIHLPTRATKRNKGRVIPYGKIRLVKDIVTAFFVTDTEVGLGRVAIWQRVQRMASRAGLTHRITPHGLRATGACWMAQAGYSMTGLMSHFGWNELKTAQHYIEATGASAMKDMDALGEKVL